MRPGNTKLLLFPSKSLAKNRKKKNERQKEGRKRRGKIRKGGKGDGRRAERGVKRRDGEERRGGEVGLGVGGKGSQVLIDTSPTHTNCLRESTFLPFSQPEQKKL